MRVVIPNGFEPRPYQRRAMAYFDNGGTRAITVWHRRAGKDLTALHQTAKAAHQKPGLYWHIFPTSEQARKAIWTGSTADGTRILEQVFPKSIRKSPQKWSPQGEMVVELKCGSIWRMMGSDKMELVGAGPRGVVFSEYALAKPTTWDLVRPMLRESNGWAWFITTPRGSNHAKKLFDMATPESGWFRDLQTVHDTGLTYASNRSAGRLTPDALLAEERAEGMPDELVEQEYLCSWSAANVGSFYGALLARLEANGRVGANFEPDTSAVFVFLDLGRTDDTALWWMSLRAGSTEEAPRADVLDHYASHGEDLEHYFRVLEERAAKHGWRYLAIVLPHDARAKTLATRLSVVEQFAIRFGAALVTIGPELSLRDGIAATRWLLQQDIRFHARCSALATPKDCDGIEALRAYRRTWDDERKCFSELPVHDWASHTADSARYMAVYVKLAAAIEVARRPPPPPQPVQTRHPTLDELWSMSR